jgi:hypothetical protein
MTQYIIYSLDIKSFQLDIIGIEQSQEEAKSIQNSYSFKLLCDLNKRENLYKLLIRDHIVQIIEVNITLQKGWISGIISEEKKPIYEIGILPYNKKQNVNVNINSNHYTANEISSSSSLSLFQSSNTSLSSPSPPSPPPLPKQQSLPSLSSLPSTPPKTLPNWEDIFFELKKRRATIN